MCRDGHAIARHDAWGPDVWKSDYLTILKEYLSIGDHRITEVSSFNFRDPYGKIDYEKVQTATGYIQSFIEYIKEKVPDSTLIVNPPKSPDYKNLYYEATRTNNDLGKQLTAC